MEKKKPTLLVLLVSQLVLLLLISELRYVRECYSSTCPQPLFAREYSK